MRTLKTAIKTLFTKPWWKFSEVVENYKHYFEQYTRLRDRADNLIMLEQEFLIWSPDVKHLVRYSELSEEQKTRAYQYHVLGWKDAK